MRMIPAETTKPSNPLVNKTDWRQLHPNGALKRMLQWMYIIKHDKKIVSWIPNTPESRRFITQERLLCVASSILKRNVCILCST